MAGEGCALDWNEPALRFYEKLGATRLEEWRMFRLDRAGMRRLVPSGAAVPTRREG